MKWDLVKIYSQLDLPPDCTLEEFKHAYRRRIAQLHPDRGGGANSPEVHLLLPELVWLYATATRFHRRHGRLPGALPVRDPPPMRDKTPVVPMPAQLPSGPSLPSSPDDASEQSMRRGWVLAALLLVLALILASSWDEGATEQSPRPEHRHWVRQRTDLDQVTGLPAILPDRLETGMDAATVRAIQGEPLFINDTRWDYGPSWLKFEKGRLVDWHSSPLHQLKTATPAPVAKPRQLGE